MSERDLLEGLNDSLAPEDLMMVDEDRGIAEQNARLARLRGEPGAQERSIRAPNAGRGSWYSQLPEHGWVDRQDRPGSNALGVRDENQGIALPSRATLGQWFDVTFPDGQTHRLQQTDVGPAKWTGKGIDISAAAAHQAGYTPKNFPTGAGFTWKPAEGEPSYDTEDRTAVGLGGSRAYAPEMTTVPDTGRRQMADQPRGILDFLTGGQQQQQQPGGLLGMLGDPETMAYLAMIAKGASPYSALDPNSMLSNAHTLAMKREALRQQQAEQAIDNRRADEALNLRRQEYGLQREDRQARDAAAFEERQQKRDMAAKQKEIDDEVRRNISGGAPADPTVTAVPEGTRSPEDQIAQLNAELAKNPSAPIAKSIERRIEQLQKGPSATTQKLIKDAENEIAPMQATREKLGRMQELLPNVAEGYGAGMYGSVGGRLPLGLAPQAAKDTLEFNNLAEIETIRDMSRTMKGSTAVKEMEVWLSKAADPSLPREIRQNNLNMAIRAIDREMAIRANRVKELQEGTYGRTPKSGGGGGGGGERPPLSSFNQ